MTQKERLESIRDLLSSHPFVSLGELEKLFPEVTSMTLRRDIDRLESKGELIKVRGGARSMKFLTTSAEDDFGKRLYEATEEKTEEIDGIKYIKDPSGVIYVMNGPAGDQAKGESSIYAHDESLYAYALPSKVSSWAEFDVSGDVITVTVKTAQSGTAANIISWGIKKTK